ncbi:MAG: hypothetical protein J5781_07585 [Clostridia bacterium]|nr:hypothetical protein [Clostridia bacterium]
MHRKKSVFASILIVIVAVLLVSSLLVSCQKKDKQEKQATYLFLGDSIAEALLGPSPISERDSYGYYSIVGQVNGARYVNRAISGLTSIGFKNSLARKGFYEEDDGFYREYWIDQADVIFISMLGNDLLSAYMVDYAIETGVQSTAKGKEDVSESFTERMTERCIPNVNDAMDSIYRINPDVTVIWQTLYNPFTDNTVLLDDEDWARYNEKVASGEIDSKYSFRDLADILVRAVNGIVYDWQAAHPDKKFYVSDVKGAFDAVFEADQAAGESLIFSDWIHPSVRGHALIANCLEDTLCSLGLSDKGAATEKYKQLVSDRIDRLYPDLASAKTAVAAESTFTGVSSAYFASTAGVMPRCVNNVTSYDGGFFSEEKEFELESLKLSGTELVTIYIEQLAEEMDLDIDQSIVEFVNYLLPNGFNVFSRYNSYIDFNDDGTFELSLALDHDVTSLVNSLMFFLGKDAADFDVVDFYKNVPFCDYNTTYEMYFSELFPGFDITDLKNSLDILASVGCTIGGIDTESDNFKALAKSLKETGTIPEDFRLPENLKIKLNGRYTVQTLGEGDAARQVIYLNLVRTGKDTVPMFCALYTKTEMEEKVLFKIEFCSVRISFVL